MLGAGESGNSLILFQSLDLDFVRTFLERLNDCSQASDKFDSYDSIKLSKFAKRSPKLVKSYN